MKKISQTLLISFIACSHVSGIVASQVPGNNTNISSQSNLYNQYNTQYNTQLNLQYNSSNLQYNPYNTQYNPQRNLQCNSYNLQYNPSNSYNIQCNPYTQYALDNNQYNQPNQPKQFYQSNSVLLTENSLKDNNSFIYKQNPTGNRTSMERQVPFSKDRLEIFSSPSKNQTSIEEETSFCKDNEKLDMADIIIFANMIPDVSPAPSSNSRNLKQKIETPSLNIFNGSDYKNLSNQKFRERKVSPRKISRNHHERYFGELFAKLGILSPRLGTLRSRRKMLHKSSNTCSPKCVKKLASRKAGKHAVNEMVVGPPQTAIRSSLQTASWCCSQKLWY